TPASPPSNPFPQPQPQPPAQPQPPQNPRVQPQAQSIDRPAAPRISPQPVHLAFKPGEEKSWPVVGMDLDGLTTAQLALRYDPQSVDVLGLAFGRAQAVNTEPQPV